jgi:enoyl-CoA hydratase/carnithine racemase
MLNSIEHGEVLEIQMNRPPANALNVEMVDAISTAHENACAQGAQAIILSGLPGMFSAGLDVPELLQLDRAAINRFWTAFLSLMKSLAGSPVPVVAAITGHSPAGGAVLAVHCDYRVAVAGSFKIGFNEVRVGLPVPRTILLAVERLVGGRWAAQLATQGLLLSPEQAREIGLVDELAEPEAVVQQALTWARQTISLPLIAMNRTRLLAKNKFIQELQAADDANVATDYWFSEETQAGMQRLVENLRK